MTQHCFGTKCVLGHFVWGQNVYLDILSGEWGMLRDPQPPTSPEGRAGGQRYCKRSSQT